MTPTAAPPRRRPAYLRPDLLGVVIAGGALGTLTRAQLFELFPTEPGGFPWVTFWVNVTGSLVLGALVQALALHGPDEGRRRLLRLGLGTGVLGGFTTYSTFALESAVLARQARVVPASAYDVLSVAAGVLAAWTGVVLAEAARRGRRDGDGS